MRNWFFGSFMTIGFLLNAQTEESKIVVLTLDDCIKTAIERNTTLKRAKNTELSAQYRRMQAIGNFFPDLNASVNYDYFFGNFFDTNAARQVSATTNSSNPNVSSRIVLFNGLSNHYTNAQRKNELLTASYSVKTTEDNIEALILSNFLVVINDKENIKIEKDRLALLENQLEREKKRLSVGVGDLTSVYNLQSQIANQKLTLNNLENTYKGDHLALIQSMQLDITQAEYEVADYEIAEEELLVSLRPFDEVLDEILSKNPSIAAARHSMDASRYQMKAARASYYPTISAFGVVGTNYSSNGARNPETGAYEADASFQDQVRYNEFEYVNFTIDIPIFSRLQSRNAVQQAKITMANSELAMYDAVNNVTNLVQRAYLDLVNAQNSYVSAKSNLEVAEQTFEFMKKRLETGNTDYYTYGESLNNKNRAELTLVNAKYSIIFRKKILELYSSE